MKNGRIETNDILSIPPGGTVVYNLTPQAAASARALIYQIALRHPREGVKRYSTIAKKDEFGRTVVNEAGEMSLFVTAVKK